jgi:DNA-binding XRE family transcriptional regulator
MDQESAIFMFEETTLFCSRYPFLGIFSIEQTVSLRISRFFYRRMETLDYLKKRFGRENVAIDDEKVDVIESSWFQSVSKRTKSGGVVRIYRENFEFSQQQLAEKAGIAKASYISDIENGRRSVSKNMAIKFAQIFNVSVEMFM